MTMDDSLMDQTVVQALIAETEALGWENPDHLVAHDGTPIPQEGFAFIGKLFTLKPQNIYHVHATLSSVCGFTAPLSIEVMAPNKYLFIIPQECHYQSVISQGPWNVRGSLLLF